MPNYEDIPPEVTTGVANLVQNSRVEAYLKLRVIKRIIFRELDIVGPKKWGHWWVEIFKADCNENFIRKNLMCSIGWWPVEANLICPAWLTDGCLNNQVHDIRNPDSFYSKDYDLDPPKDDRRFDPHALRYDPGDTDQGELDWEADAIYHPAILDERTDEQVIRAMIVFATSYKGRNKGWRWPHDEDNPESSNCRQFILEMREECKLYRSTMPVKRPASVGDGL